MSRRFGFTLVEVMVVMSVTALLSALILVYSSSTRDTLLLFTEKVRVTQLIYRAKSLALSTYTEGGVSRCGYGVRFNHTAGTYDLVSYSPASCAERSIVDINPATFETVQQAAFTLPKALQFDLDEATAQDAAYIIFIPPDPTILIAREDGSLITNTDGRIGLKVTGRDVGAIVKINAAGQITY
jgi:prepilin-type N-terminal cleavage/methylation domain-containing protein